MNNRKGSTKIVATIVVGVLVISGLIYVAVSKNDGDRTSIGKDWSEGEGDWIPVSGSYRDEKYGFEFGYPNTVMVRNTYNSSFAQPNLVAEVSLYKLPEGQDRDGLVSIYRTSLQEILANNEYINGAHGKIISNNVVTVNNKQWTMIVYDTLGYIGQDYLAEEGNYTFWISIGTRLNEPERNIILSTFRFTQ